MSPERRHPRSRSATARSSSSPAPWPEAVVDELEVVEVDERDRRDRRVGAADAGQGVLDPVEEQGPVRQPGERVVERLVAQLVLERAATGDVADREDDAVDVGVVEQVHADDLGVDHRVVGPQQPRVDGADRLGRALHEVLEEAGHVVDGVGVEHLVEGGAVEVDGEVAEHPDDRRRLVPDAAVAPDDHHGVAAVAHELLEARLAALLVQLLGLHQRVERQRDLGAEDGEALVDLLGHPLGRGHRQAARALMRHGIGTITTSSPRLSTQAHRAGHRWRRSAAARRRCPSPCGRSSPCGPEQHRWGRSPPARSRRSTRRTGAATPRRSRAAPAPTCRIAGASRDEPSAPAASRTVTSRRAWAWLDRTTSSRRIATSTSSSVVKPPSSRPSTGSPRRCCTTAHSGPDADGQGQERRGARGDSSWAGRCSRSVMRVADGWTAAAASTSAAATQRPAPRRPGSFCGELQLRGPQEDRADRQPEHRLDREPARRQARTHR